MEYSNLVFLVPQVLLSLSLATAQLQTCSNRGTYSNNSTYSENLNLVLSSLASNITATDGFYNTTAGQDPDKVYALALCRGDLASDKCYNCINSSNQDIIKQCPNKKEALTWGASECMVRYSNHYIFSTMEVEPVTFVPNPNNVTSLDEFNRTLINLMEILVTQASSGSASLKFATGNANFTSSKKIYALVQCTPDLLRNDCRVCLEGAMGDIPDCCGGKEGGRVLRPSCLVWFELFQFYDSSTFDPSVHLPPPTQVHSPVPPPPTLFPPNTSTKGNRSTMSRTVIIVVVPAVILVTLIILTCAILRKWKLKQNDNNDDDDMKKLESLQFHFCTIRTATDDFSDANKLGQGGFGSVYKGQLSNSQKIAVKRLSGYSAQGEVEFKNEILLISKLQHRNLVTLLGFCLEGRERLLIYEFMGNGSLDHFIFDPIRCAELNWEQRYKIICGIARGLLYLHEDSRLRIIHRDLKASNILLDEEMNPKISDFGMARLCVMDQTQVNTSKIAGTYGYMAPEYAANGRFSVKSDVFSFGVLILEIVSGKRNDCLCNSESAEHLISYAWKNWREENALNLIDATLGESSRREIIRCIHIGLLCVQENFADRPTMAAVVLTLSSHSSTLPLPSHPAFLLYSATESGLPHPGHTLEISALDQSTNGTDYLSV